MTNDIEVINTQHATTHHRVLVSYILGFLLSIALTLLAYFTLIEHVFTGNTLVFAIVTFGVLQLVVQVVFFLHLSGRPRPHWNLVVFVFTIFMVAFLVAGSIWIMNNLNYNMTGMTPQTTNEGYIPQ